MAALRRTLLALALLLTASSAAAIDLTGKWRVEYGQDASAEFVDVTDVSGSVSFTLESLPSQVGTPVAITGSFSDPTLTLDCPGTCGGNATVFLGGDWFDGRLLLPSFSVHRLLANRCECFDGNTADGDGCDATCRVEPCWSCTGMPSTCTPTPDGGSCSDASPCTTAETCSAGVCSGTPVTACVDLTGVWDTIHVGEGEPPELMKQIIEQWDTAVLFREFFSGRPRFFGSIVPSTGAFTLEWASTNPAFCTIPHEISGTAALDGQSYDASGAFNVVAVVSCFDLQFTETGTRQCPGVGCLPPPIVPAIPAAGAVSLGLLLVFATWVMRRRLS